MRDAQDAVALDLDRMDHSGPFGHRAGCVFGTASWARAGACRTSRAAASATLGVPTWRATTALTASARRPPRAPRPCGCAAGRRSASAAASMHGSSARRSTVASATSSPAGSVASISARSSSGGHPRLQPTPATSLNARRLISPTITVTGFSAARRWPPASGLQAVGLERRRGHLEARATRRSIVGRDAVDQRERDDDRAAGSRRAASRIAGRSRRRRRRRRRRARGGRAATSGAAPSDGARPGRRARRRCGS